MDNHIDEHRANYKEESEGGAGELPSLVSNSDRPHLAWAQYIKQQHYHLQRAFCSTCKHNDHSGTLEGLHEDDMNHEPRSRTNDEELKRWQRLINSKEETERLRDYARAMHYLATKYWEAPLPKLNSPKGFKNCGENGQKCGLPTTATTVTSTATSKASPAAAAESANAILGRKRSRDVSIASADTIDETGDQIRSGDLQQRRYDDRIQASLDCVAAFYLGQPAGKEGGEGAIDPELLFDDFPLIVSRTLKPWRCDFFSKNARMATKSEIEEQMLQWSCEAGDEELMAGDVAHEKRFCTPQTAWEQSMRYVRLMRKVRAKESAKSTSKDDDFVLSVPALHAIDVGSCYGPFFGRSFSHCVLGSVPLHVVAMDLCPYTRSCLHSPPQDCAQLSGRVWKGDWLSVTHFKLPKLRPASCALGATCDAPYLKFTDKSIESAGEEEAVVKAVALESFDVVFFCLFLSYLPSARLRYRACVNAYLALKEGGLLVIVSTRTQGSRRRKWVKEWVVAISSIGFARVHQSIRKKIVVLCFEKQSHSETRRLLNDLSGLERDDEVSGALNLLLEQLNSSPYASDGLHVMADEGI